ncbi:YecA family protein [Methanofollis ethanolicus]|uniref:YecA family protein n=1 Tax=Methanofollis ethanolicus TaxID=488124 RepID=UPI000AA4BA7F|nr:SEC-C metal-binding domain-containing protein [Methanofollis ethanolicus]
MSGKIGRNDPCPCGSGKKYKNCCYGRFDDVFSKVPKAEFGLLKSYFRTLRGEDLIATIGGLQLVPENDYHAVRLEAAAQVACSIKRFGDTCIDIEDFCQHLNRYLPTISDIGLKEDPPEHLFTENISYLNGDNNVYPSIYHEENLILENIFITINSCQDEFPDDFNKDVLSRSLAILTISNEIARRLGHRRYMDTPHDWTSKREDISLPTDSEFITYKDAVTFQKKEIEKIIPAINEVIIPFISDIGSEKFQNLDPGSNQLAISPLVNFGSEFVVLNPISLLCALRHNIIQTAIEYHIEYDFAKYYREILWSNSLKYLFLMGYDLLDYLFPPLNETLPVEEGLFRIDSDKIAYVQLICDPVEGYDIKNPKGEWDTKELIEKIRKRDIEVLGSLKKDLSSSTDIFILKIIGHIGRESYLKYQNIEQIRTLLISAENLKIISLSGMCDRLTLWKYVKAASDASDYYHYFSYSFLDIFSFYQEKDTLILESRNFPKVVPIPPGLGKKLRLKVARMYDSHLVPLGEGDQTIYAPVVNAYFDSQIPIYQLEELVSNCFGYEVEGYYQPLWILYYDTVDELAFETFEIVKDFTKTIAYWLSQFTPGLKEYLKPLGTNPIHIFLKCENIENWCHTSKAFLDNNSGDDSFQIQIKGRNIVFFIPQTFLKQIIGSDNSGERVLLNGLLRAISYFIEGELGESSLTSQQIDSIIKNYAPLGIKKQLLLFSNLSNGLLSDGNFPEPRLIQYHDVQEQSLGLMSELKECKFAENLTQSEKIEICKKIVEVYLKRLKSLVKQYRGDEILTILIGLNDSILHMGEEMHFLVPYQIACYPDDSEYPKTVMKKLSRIDQTMLCVRTLIEIIVAEPPYGNKQSNSDDIDKMLAILHNFIDWATAADFYYNQILQSEFQYGEAGRIYIPMQDLEAKYIAFLKEKTKEYVEGSYDGYKEVFDCEKKQDLPRKIVLLEEMDKAVSTEFGFDTTQLSRFFCCLIHSTELFICPEQQGPVYSLNISEFKKRVKQALSWTDQDVNLAIKEFSLKKRRSWEDPPRGYSFEADIAPWKFRRRLSHTRRPLLIGSEPKDDPIIMWGSLQSERSLKYIAELIANGRYDVTFSTPEMKSFIHKILLLKGGEFTSYVEEWFSKNSTWFVKKNIDIPISIEKKSNWDNLGDVDVLGIDEVNGVIYSIECKNINFGRNAREMANEIVRFYHGSEEEDSWIAKHKRRDTWLKENYDIVIRYFSRLSKQYQVKSLVLTSEAIPSAYLHDLDPEIPIISLNQIERDGLGVLQKM